MMAIVEEGRVCEITGILLYLTVTRAHFSLDRILPLLPDQNYTTRKLIRHRKCIAIKQHYDLGYRHNVLRFLFLAYPQKKLKLNVCKNERTLKKCGHGQKKKKKKIDFVYALPL